MSKVNRNIIRTAMGIKLLLLIGMIISIVSIGYQQLKFQNSEFPEHADFLKEKEGAVLIMTIFLIPWLLSLIVDFKELKKESLKSKWYIMTVLLLIGYFINFQLKNEIVSYLIAISMTVGLIFIIRKQKRIE